MPNMSSETEEMERLLTQGVEHVRLIVLGNMKCPFCGRWGEQGHTGDCYLANWYRKAAAFVDKRRRVAFPDVTAFIAESTETTLVEDAAVDLQKIDEDNPDAERQRVNEDWEVLGRKIVGS